MTVILLTISSILFYDIYSFDFIILKYNMNMIEEYTLIILFLIIIELLFFKKNVYSHHILVIIVIVIFIIYYRIQKKFLLSNFFLFVQIYAYSFSFLLIKYINTNYFINIYLLGTLFGLSTLIYYSFKKPMFFLSVFHMENIFITFSFFFVLVINHFLYYKTISILSPIYTLITDYLSILIYFKMTDLNKFEILFSILTIITCLVYLEIIELNFCGLNLNIRKNIEKRADNEINCEINDSYSSDESLLNKETIK